MSTMNMVKTIYMYGPARDKQKGRNVYRLFADVYRLQDLHDFAQEHHISGSNYQVGAIINYYRLEMEDPLIAIFKDGDHPDVVPIDRRLLAEITKGYQIKKEITDRYGIDPYPKIVLLDCRADEYKAMLTGEEGGKAKTPGLMIHPSRVILLGSMKQNTDRYLHSDKYAGIVYKGPTLITEEAQYLRDQGVAMPIVGNNNFVECVKEFNKKLPAINLSYLLQRGI